ncbi:MAG: hypothetical protein DI539_09620 [Flavobacterium psychrophilum]|nr:MAG: hypothetical protein DI539_09620 [Flavobacterium psychrophilum]
MKNFLISILILFPFLLLAQSTAKDYIRAGVQLHDKGDYNGALESYEKALAVDKGNEEAYYEMGLTNLNMKNYDKTSEYADKLIKNKKDYVAKGYHLKGMSLDYMGKPKDAIAAFKKGTKADPKYTTLYYSIAITSTALKDEKSAVEALEEGLSHNRYHLKSHYMLGIMMQDQRPKSLLALYHYLLLAPSGKTANSAYNLILSQQKIGVEVKDDKNINVFIKPIDDKNDFAHAELMLSMMEVSKNLEENKNKSDFELFSESTKSFFTVLKELNEKEKHKDFWWTFYVDFYSELVANEEMYETFTYYISQDIKNTAVETWLRKNPEKVAKLEEWVANYKKA